MNKGEQYRNTLNYVGTTRTCENACISYSGRSWAQACKTVEISCDHNECNGILMRSAEWRLILGFKLSLNGIIDSLTCTQHVYAQHTCIWLTIWCYCWRYARGKWALWEPWWKENGGRWPTWAELNFCSSVDFWLLKTEMSSCPGQLPHEPFKIEKYTQEVP